MRQVRENLPVLSKIANDLREIPPNKFNFMLRFIFPTLPSTSLKSHDSTVKSSPQAISSYYSLVASIFFKFRNKVL